jgi:hypothetical protein
MSSSFSYMFIHFIAMKCYWFMHTLSVHAWRQMRVDLNTEQLGTYNFIRGRKHIYGIYL